MSMLFSLFFLLIIQYYNSSMHILSVLVMIELALLAYMIYSFVMLFSLFMSLMILLIGVCVGALGVTLYISNTQGKGVSYKFPFL